jgi:site-specific recombinase XerD
MTIYAEKNKRGAATGVWIVELRQMTNGVSKTIRQRTRDHAEAKRIEASLRSAETDIQPTRFPIVIRTPSFTRSPAIRTSVDSDSPYEGSGSGFDLTTLAPKIFTLRDLYEGGQSVYKGTKDKERSLKRLHTSLETLGWDTDIQEVRTPAFDYLVEVLHERGLSPKTINRHIYTVSAALRWALSRELIPGMPHVPRQPEGIGRINFLTEEDQDRLIQWLRDHDFPDVAFATEVLLITGFRISEYLGLKTSNVRGDWVYLNPGETKNDQGRAACIEGLADELRAQIEAGMPSYKKIWKTLSVASAALSIKPKVTPHVLRHTTATRLTTKGVSLATVGRMLGHKSLNTTLKYSHTEDQALIAAARLMKVRGKSSG